jgi:hypothetical protein
LLAAQKKERLVSLNQSLINQYRLEASKRTRIEEDHNAPMVALQSPERGKDLVANNESNRPVSESPGRIVKKKKKLQHDESAGNDESKAISGNVTGSSKSSVRKPFVVQCSQQHPGTNMLFYWFM